MKRDASLADVRAWLAAARRVVVFTGAGVSAESGIPTFRDALTGLWARYDPERLATEAGFRADPALVWRWYAERRDAIGAAQPNAAHRAIAASESRGGSHLTVVTQNIDGLHARAGSRDVLELHGSILRARCLDGCGDPAHLAPGYDWRGDPRVPPPFGSMTRASTSVPRYRRGRWGAASGYFAKLPAVASGFRAASVLRRASSRSCPNWSSSTCSELTIRNAWTRSAKN